MAIKLLRIRLCKFVSFTHICSLTISTFRAYSSVCVLMYVCTYIICKAYFNIHIIIISDHIYCACVDLRT